MREPTTEAKGDSARWRKPAIVTASLALHVVILGYMGFTAIEGPRRYGETPTIPDSVFPDRAIFIELEPRPTVRGDAARTRVASQPNPAMQPIRDNGTRVRETPGRAGSAEPGEIPAPPSPRYTYGVASSAAVAPPADVGSSSWRVRPESFGDRAGRGLRTGTIGCASPDLLSAQERLICDDRLGQRAATAAPIDGTGNPERDARFAREGQRALAAYEARRAPLRGGVGVIGPQDGPGSNFGMGVAGQHLPSEYRLGAQTTINSAGETKSGFNLKLGPIELGPRD